MTCSSLPIVPGEAQFESAAITALWIPADPGFAPAFGRLTLP